MRAKSTSRLLIDNKWKIFFLSSIDSSVTRGNISSKPFVDSCSGKRGIGILALFCVYKHIFGVGVNSVCTLSGLNSSVNRISSLWFMHTVTWNESNYFISYNSILIPDSSICKNNIVLVCFRTVHSAKVLSKKWHNGSNDDRTHDISYRSFTMTFKI